MRACKYDSAERSFFFQFFTSQLCTTFYNLEGTFELLKCSVSCPQSDRENWKDVGCSYGRRNKTKNEAFLAAPALLCHTNTWLGLLFVSIGSLPPA